GLTLDEIRRALNAPEFDRVAALHDHRKKLVTEAARLRELLQTIDETLAHLHGSKIMNEESMYRGFDAETRARSEAWAVERYGKAARLGIQTRDAVIQDWTPEEHDSNQKEMAAIFTDFAAAYSDDLKAESERTQAIVLRLHGAASKHWTG